MQSTSTDRSGMVTGLFYDRSSAERAYEGLTSRGYTKDDINIAMSDDTRKRHFSDQSANTELGTKAAEGAGIGGAIGGTLGAIVAGIAATGTSLALPGLGLIIAGPLVAAAAGAGAGAMTGGLVGALIGWGIPEERVKHYESGLQQGGMLLGVRPRSEDDASFIERHWRENQGMHVYRPGTHISSASTGMSDGDDHTLVAVFDKYDDADAATRALVGAGFDRERVQVNPDSDEAIPQKIVASDSAARGNTGGITGFFENLFGVDNSTEYRDAYAESVRRGSTVLTVDARNAEEAERASDILHRFEPVDIDERASQWKQQGWSGHDGTATTSRDGTAGERTTMATASGQLGGKSLNVGEARVSGAAVEASVDAIHIPVVEEELQVGKRQISRGGVRVFKRVTERPVQESVQLREEHVQIERRPVDRPVSDADLNRFQEGSFELRETGEEAVVAKTAKVVEEVVIGKQVTEHTEQISDTVRRTEIDVERIDGEAGSASIPGRGKPSRGL